MITPAAEIAGRIVRVLTYGKEADAIDQAVADAIADGRRVLVKAASAGGEHSDAAAEALGVAQWAEGLSQKHGLSWERVGGDVLFRRSPSRPAPRMP